MEKRILVLGKGDNVITMILDNLYSYSIDSLKDFGEDIVVYNNLDLPILNSFEPRFRISLYILILLFTF